MLKYKMGNFEQIPIVTITIHLLDPQWGRHLHFRAERAGANTEHAFL